MVSMVGRNEISVRDASENPSIQQAFMGSDGRHHYTRSCSDTFSSLPMVPTRQCMAATSTRVSGATVARYSRVIPPRTAARKNAMSDSAWFPLFRLRTRYSRAEGGTDGDSRGFGGGSELLREGSVSDARAVLRKGIA